MDLAHRDVLNGCKGRPTGAKDPSTKTSSYCACRWPFCRARCGWRAGPGSATALNPMGKVALVGANFSALVHYWQEKIDKAANATRQSLGAAYAHQGRSPR